MQGLDFVETKSTIHLELVHDARSVGRASCCKRSQVIDAAWVHAVGPATQGPVGVRGIHWSWSKFSTQS